ncbi:MAG: signal peptidase II [Deltaproteobacteria bacterium]
MALLRKFRVPLAAALALTAADQATKGWIVSHFELYEARAVLVRFFHIVHVRNTGVAFGLLSNLDPGWVNPLLVLATLLAVAGVLAYLRVLPPQGPAPAGLGLILGGAVGNLIDRARLGYVVDFLDLHWDHHHWPAFNVADIGITIGVLLLLIDMLFWPRGEESSKGTR